MLMKWRVNHVIFWFILLIHMKVIGADGQEGIEYFFDN